MYHQKGLIVNMYGNELNTPCYIYHRKLIIDNYIKLKNALIEGSSLYYSMKANPMKEICQMLGDAGAGIEVASAGELDIALRAGISPEKIIFTSPGKTREELNIAIEKDIKIINVDSVEEARIIDEICEAKGKTLDISIRINPSYSNMNAKIKMSGVPSQFGIDEEIIDEALLLINELKHVRICGFQIYMGTQMLNAIDIVNNTDYALDLFFKLSKTYSINLRFLNVGGGFGVKYFPNESDLDLELLREQMERLRSKYIDRLNGVEVIFESGRFITAEAGEYVVKVLYVKESKGIKYVICDGGSNFHSAAAFLGRFVRNNFPIRCHPFEGEKEIATVVGPLCTPLDVIGQKVEVNKHIKPGDLIIIDKSGAYGLTYSPLEFLHHNRPLEIIDDEK